VDKFVFSVLRQIDGCNVAAVFFNINKHEAESSLNPARLWARSFGWD
jgi:hypothetical protein